MKQLPLFLALDLETKEQALAQVAKSSPWLKGYKIGPRLFLKYGPNLIQQIKKLNPKAYIFLDFKFHDIPSSVLEACRSAYHMGVNYVTVHASVGSETLKLLSLLEKRYKRKTHKRKPRKCKPRKRKIQKPQIQLR